MTARLLKQDSAGLARIITNTEWWGPRSVGGVLFLPGRGAVVLRALRSTLGSLMASPGLTLIALLTVGPSRGPGRIPSYPQCRGRHPTSCLQMIQGRRASTSPCPGLAASRPATSMPLPQPPETGLQQV